MAQFGRLSIAFFVLAALIIRTGAELPTIDVGGLHIGPAATPSTSTTSITSTTPRSTTQSSTSTSASTVSNNTSPSTTPISTSTSDNSTSSPSSGLPGSTSTLSGSTDLHTIEMVDSIGSTSEISHTSERILETSTSIENVITTIGPKPAVVSTLLAENMNHSTSIVTETAHLSTTTMAPVPVPTTTLGSTAVPDVNGTISNLATDSNETTTMLGTSSTSMRPGGHPPRLSDFDCAGVEPGYYGNPKQKCDTKFYICVSRSMFAYEQRCPAKLFFDDDLKICESWIHIPACSGKSRPTILPWNETQFTLPTAAPTIDCYNFTDGNYPDPLSTPKAYCSNRFFTCVGHREFRFFCPRGLFYDHERNQCDLHERVYVCSGNRVLNETDDRFTWAPPVTWPHVNFSCTERRDGYYVEKCGNVYYSCNGGLAREFRCPDDLVFDSEWLSCEAPMNAFICSGTRRPSTQRPSTIGRHVGSTTESPLKCRGRLDGIYRDPLVKCSRVFYYCTHNDTMHNFCPGNLYYDDEFKRCDLWINIFDCSGMRPTTTLKPPSTVAPSVLPAVDFDCSRIEDGNYANPKEKCSKFFYICANMEGFQQYCPAGLYYDIETNTCDSWANIFVCSGITHKPIEATKITTPGSTQKPEFDCSLKSDGVYTNAVNACSGVYFRCVGSNTFKFFCPGGLYYDTSVDRCDMFDNVFACSGLTRPPPTPSTIAPTRPSTEKPPLDCRTLPDGDYPDPLAKNKCGHIFYTCSSGFAVKRECADKLYYDVELRICDEFWKVPVCIGSPRPVTVSVPVTIRTSGPPLSFDCTKLFDGNYADKNCSGDFWSCVGGTTFQRRCPLGFVYDAEFDDCEFPHMVPKCGGHRITTPKKVESSTGTPAGGFSCSFLQDGNYVDPAAKEGCSSIYYTCSNGMTTRVHCPADLFYDIISNACNSHDRVPACGGSNATVATTLGSKTEMAPLDKLTTSAATARPTTSEMVLNVTSTMLPVVSTSESTSPSTIHATTTVASTVPSTIHATTTASKLNTAIVSKIVHGNFTEIVTEILTETLPATTTVAPTFLTSESAKPSVGDLQPMTTTVRPTILTTEVVQNISSTIQLPTTTVQPSVVTSMIENVTESTILPNTTTEVPSTITTRRRPIIVTKIVQHNFTEIVTEHVMETPSSPAASSTISNSELLSPPAPSMAPSVASLLDNDSSANTTMAPIGNQATTSMASSNSSSALPTSTASSDHSTTSIRP